MKFNIFLQEQLAVFEARIELLFAIQANLLLISILTYRVATSSGKSGILKKCQILSV